MPELLVPKLNNQDEDYVLTDWLVADGAAVAAGEAVAVVETSKAAEELEAGTPGVLRHRLAAGTRCRPGEPIADIAGNGDAADAAGRTGDLTATVPRAVPGPAAPRSAAAMASTPGAAGTPVRTPGPPGPPDAAGGPLITRPAQALMGELGVTPEEVAALGVPVVKREHVAALRQAGPGDARGAATAPVDAARAGLGGGQGAATVPGPGPAGASASAAQVAAAPVGSPPVGGVPVPVIASGPASAGLPAPGAAGVPTPTQPWAEVAGVGGSGAGGRRVELGRVQLGVARAVRVSHQSIPAAYTVVRMDLGPALAHGRSVTRQVRRPVGLAELFVKEVARLHRDFPRFFAAVDDDGRGAVLAEAPHVGVTVDLGEGLYVPCVRDAGERTLGEIATQLMAYRIAATQGGFRESDLTGANFVVTLHTDADVVLAVPFVLPGTVCALAVTSPVDGAGANIGLAYDHRLINGREASLFLHALRTSMEGLTS